MDEDLSLQQSIDKALEGFDDDGNVKEVKEVPKDLVKDPPKVKDPKEEPVVEDEVSDDDKKKALEIWKALNDKDVAPDFIKALAAAAGLNEDSTKKEVKTAVKTLEQEFKETLGEDYEFLADKLFASLSKVIDAKVNEKTQDLRQNEADRKEAQIRDENEKAYSELEVLPHWKDLEPAILKLQDQMSPKKGVSTKEYLNNLYLVAAAQKGLNTKINAGKERVIDTEKNQRNKNDVISQLTPERTELKETAPNHGKALSLNESIAQAIREIAEKAAK